jgi:hypothetical protein
MALMLTALSTGAPAAEGAGFASPGFAVSDFATGFPTGGRFGPMGVAFDGHGKLFAVDNTDGNLYRFSSAGGSASASSLVSTLPIPGYLVGLAFDKAGDLFVAREEVEGLGDVAEIDPTNGAVIRTVASGFKPLGIATDPVSGDLFVTVVGEPLKRISNPNSANPTVSNYGEPLSTPDGIVFGPDGTIYIEDEGNIISVTGTASPTPGVATTVGYVSEADGIAVAETTNSSEPPFLAVNSNDGTITKVDLGTTPASYTTMVTGGSRGDLVAVGPDKCLYATQFESIEKVTASDGTCPFYPSSPFHCSAKIESVSPVAGQVPIGSTTGTTVTITGKSFCPGTEVQFGAVGSTGGIVEAQVQNSGQVTATVPRNAASGPVSLITPDGQHGPAVTFPINNYRNTDAFSFTNFASHGDVTWSDVAAAFGKNAYQSWSLCNGCAPLKTLIPSSGGWDVYWLINRELAGGLCFGFSLGSLKLSEGLDSLAPTADPSHNAPQWSAGSVYGLPTYETSGSFGYQLRHYLYQEATTQFSVQHYDAVSSYFEGLRHLPAGTSRAQYLYNQITNSFAHGMGIVEIFQPGEGHAIVPYGLEAHSDGSFDINVYDSNQPFTAGEVTDAALHTGTLDHSKIHVDPQGNWTYLMKLNGDVLWSGRPSQIYAISLDAMKGPLTPNGTAGPAYSSVTVGASVTQVTDGHGHSLYDAHGNLTPEAQQPDVAVMSPLTQATTTNGPVWSAPGTSLVLGPSGTYTETVAAGTLNVLGAGTDGKVSSTGGQLRIWPGGKQLRLTPASAGEGSLELTRHDSGGETTVAVAGKLAGPLTLAVGRAATITAAKPEALRLTLVRVGPGQPPQTFHASVRLGRGQHLELGSLRRLNTGLAQLHATLSGRGHRRAVTLVSRSARPMVRIRSVSAKRVRGGTRVTVRLVTRGAPSGQVVVTLRGAGRTSTSVQAAARAQVKVILLLPVQRRGQRLRVWAVALTRGRQAGRIATGAVRLR